METHIGVGVGEYIEKEFSDAKESIRLSTPTLTLSLTKKILSIAEKGVKIRIITSPRINPESEESNVLIRKSIKIGNEKNQSLKIEHKVVSNKTLPMVHVKLYVIDEKIVIFGSPNLGEVHFWKYAEYIWILREPELVNTAKKDYNKLWSLFPDSKLDISDSKRKSKNFVRKIRRKF